MHLKTELEQRWLLYQSTGDTFFDSFDKGGQTLYFGVDPTARSMHLGNFVVFMTAVNYLKKWNKLILIVGGATGMIGDPGGRDSERNFLDNETLETNVKAIEQQMHTIMTHLKKLTGLDAEVQVINNYDFYKGLEWLSFLREVGKYITVNQMMNKETVKKRIEDPEKSISFTEFSYMLMQGYDFLKLYQDHGVTLEISGSDQRWNIVTGVELVRKKLDKEVYGMTSPLLVDSAGKKFWKSAGNALWLDPEMTTPYSMYQYFLNTADEDVRRFLLILTLLNIDEVDNIVKKHQEKTELRYGQQQLANYVVETIFGENAAKLANTISGLMFGDDSSTALAWLDSQTLESIKTELWGASAALWTPLLDLIVETGLTTSKSEAKKLVAAGGVSLNDKKIDKLDSVLEASDLIGWQAGLLKKGKKSFKLILKK